MTDLKVTESGWYRTRAGELAEVVVSGLPQMFPIIGYVKEVSTMTWEKDGRMLPNGEGESVYDLVEYLGKERPKQKKVVRMAPALVLTGKPDYKVSHFLFKSEDEARELYQEVFVRWLIDSHAVEVEVPDNG